MESVNLCVCGCGEPAVYAIRHCNTRPRARLTGEHYTVEDRDYATPCWIYKNKRGPRKPGKYNTVRIHGKQVYAHRVMYEQEVGPIPPGLVLDHLCRQSTCIRPDHLEAVTNAENVRRGNNAKLTIGVVRRIRALPAAERHARTIARELGFTEFLIYQIWQEKIWREE